MKFLSNIRTRTRLVGSYVCIAILIVVVAVIGYLGMQNINNELNKIYDNRTVPMNELGNIRSALQGTRGDILKYIMVESQRKDVKETLTNNLAVITKNLDTYRAGQLSEEEKVALDTFDQAMVDYSAGLDEIMALVDGGDNEAAMASIADGGKTKIPLTNAITQITRLVDLNVQYAEQEKEEAAVTFSNSLRLLVIFVIVCLVLAIGMGLIVSTDITAPLAIAGVALTRLSQGDMLRDMAQKTKDVVTKRKDEIGDMGQGLHAMVGYLQSMGVVAQNIANNDLTETITPHSEKDELGQAFATMVKGLTETIRNINENATNLAAASEQLASAAV
ncbi:MAG: methyl-accepting chemotaxis protein [Leptolinea sp.]|jgi:methyl-accepting chemotaxis protein|nr:methyl-accepting chemotaxis protein [Leptolinea sp.]